jgi:large subunit ribosomal protein L21
MYAVFVDGSRQYQVSEGDVVKVDYREAEAGAPIEFAHVVLFANGDDLRIGQPVVEGVRILGDVVDHPSIKVTIQHFRRRKNYRRFKGHRQWYTAVRVKSILLPGQQPPPPASKPETPAASPTPAPSPAAT